MTAQQIESLFKTLAWTVRAESIWWELWKMTEQCYSLVKMKDPEYLKAERKRWKHWEGREETWPRMPRRYWERDAEKQELLASSPDSSLLWYLTVCGFWMTWGEFFLLLFCFFENLDSHKGSKLSFICIYCFVEEIITNWGLEPFFHM